MAAHPSSIHSFQSPHHGAPTGRDGYGGHSAQSHRRRRPPQQPQEKGHGHWLLLLLAVTVAAAGLALWAFVYGLDKRDAVIDLVDQMKASAEGTIGPIHHVLGGRLYARREGGQVTVVVSDLRQKDCVQAGWVLMRRGIISINGMTPQRVSAAVLADLCAQGDDASKLEWSPKPSD